MLIGRGDSENSANKRLALVKAVHASGALEAVPRAGRRVLENTEPETCKLTTTKNGSRSGRDGIVQGATFQPPSRVDKRFVLDST